ncbi:MAG TPA: transcriptional regulator [Flavobacteriales bacterium]|nr:transcriptional regulator [Flavobacteriales bacterium]
MIETLITSRTRVKLLLKFFLNPSSYGYLRGLATEFGESSNAIRIELNRFEEAGMLISRHEGNKKMYRANSNHPLFSDVRNIILKYVGVDKLINHVVENLGELKEVYLLEDFARGIDKGVVDLFLVGKINMDYMSELIRKAEKTIGRKVRYLTSETREEAADFLQDKDHLLIWNDKKPVSHE